MADAGELKYTEEHEWVRVDGDTVTVGITAYAADKLGDIVFVDLPEVGSEAAAGRVIAEIESTKSVGELYAPAAGTVAEANDRLGNEPELINKDPLGEGWLVRLTLTGDLPELLSAEQYGALIGE
ncbi:glycine cleavage system protein GcvH [Microbacterium sp. STN6]|uniref:glycine cleavage system protein GcvH n=1 Tax=Microbacterium sp. STN6 TaxID=2995588 RepID=UPI002260968D|nr:glycine cleavage system protein GcvH [Microbacterium sp. STN6]MCX7521903.1 glycine cleavage system protein GcvH [Microbacterium sp. STN6]